MKKESREFLYAGDVMKKKWKSGTNARADAEMIFLFVFTEV
jgi:hypothetical protein